MIALIPKLLICFLIYCLSSDLLIHGQSNLTDIPFNIDIKKNIKNIKAINLSSIGKELSYIPLETTPECLIQTIRKILFSESYIFVSEYYKLLQFDKNGKFIRQIGSAGIGPGEYRNVGDFCVDEQKKEIYITCISPNRLLTFGFDGVIKNSVSLSFRPSKIILKDQNSLMHHLWNSPGRNDPSWIITNRQGIITTSIRNNLKRINRPGFVVQTTPLYLFDNSVHFMEYGIDTLYYFKDTQRKPYAIFFLDDLKLDPDLLLTPSMRNINKLRLSTIYENDELLFITFHWGTSNSAMCAIYNKKTDVVTFLKDNVFKNDLGGGIGFWPKQITDDNILVDYIDAFDLLKNIIPSSLRAKLTVNSNPVLMLLKK